MTTLQFDKHIVTSMAGIYTANAFAFDGGCCIGVGPEEAGNPWLVRFPSLEKEEAGVAPGGMMSFIPLPGRDDVLVSVMGLFPPFRGVEGGVYCHRRIRGKWMVTKVIELPFAHRCEVVQRGDVSCLLVATVSRHKENPADWSQPGEVYLALADEPDKPTWDIRRVVDNLHRNHGMQRMNLDGTEVVAVSGAEGIFAISPDANTRCAEVVQLFDREVSEFAFVDIDGDGAVELATIEPFHGDSLHIYRRTPHGWDRMYDAPLSFGHGLSGGQIGGMPAIVVGNRRGEASLELHFAATRGAPLQRCCIERGTGTTQTQFFNHAGRDYILAANQLKNEAAVYSLITNP
jgi:hypothetical protein